MTVNKLEYNTWHQLKRIDVEKLIEITKLRNSFLIGNEK